MPNQIISTGAFPIKLRESSSSRPSGLNVYQATYIILRGTFTSHIGEFSAGSIITSSLGSYHIYPHPNIVSANDSPFDEVQVTAYGTGLERGATLDRQVKTFEILELSKSFSETVTSTDAEGVETSTNYDWTVYEEWVAETATLLYVGISDSSTYLEPTETINKTMTRRWRIGKVKPGGTIELSILWNEGTRDIRKTSFGFYSEVEVVKGFIPEIL